MGIREERGLDPHRVGAAVSLCITHLHIAIVEGRVVEPRDPSRLSFEVIIPINALASSPRLLYSGLQPFGGGELPHGRTSVGAKWYVGCRRAHLLQDVVDLLVGRLPNFDLPVLLLQAQAARIELTDVDAGLVAYFSKQHGFSGYRLLQRRVRVLLPQLRHRPP